MTLVNHIAIIMDGNGRWGKKNFNKREIGHYYGMKNLKKIVEYCYKSNIKFLTIFSLSTDNFKRPQSELNNLYKLFEDYFIKNFKYFKKKNIALRIIGENKRLPKKIIKIIRKINQTKYFNPKFNLNVAFNYSSKNEIIHSFKKILKKKIPINKTNLSNNLYLSKICDPDILIRTGGMRRLSDFLLWQLSYSEIFFLKKLWPDFSVSDLKKIIKNYLKVKKNYGNI